MTNNELVFCTWPPAPGCIHYWTGSLLCVKEMRNNVGNGGQRATNPKMK